ncbi:MAG: 50S ribosomal protein L30 [Hydrogenophilales bacterium CG03_land_8_20_14_0_80_62_28]|nr:50S ribosomal protein L30 [Betaproteobacteria bacterium]OIO79403.1 MAG: 50S ribosomal protein L30 [Hydrogenophilaceae bacterium CG1_02_62_390]PIV22152.1 MAG: 50S ribosomal protein L30 [Hydrogenophilales bacterium CG03_land_8_20_14_0_80_62_28]PIW37767.1 MAG: 50S ribosomal protein L30 [Hydrogenophilales bacterium CG15_BIG_FIL_POST_REV_8_21_14_020_62_31]PIW71105.1 MAG: 50S ribosomal protein L30 [Hydrogenophilales bacterium CG12_big_fil_rev_8_21_14_0_65_61_21]PIX00622.1 MAG: 50S ribosomal prote
MSDKKIKVTLVKSPIGTNQKHRACVRGLGLKRLNQSVVLEDTSAVRGMVFHVNFLVKCEAA